MKKIIVAFDGSEGSEQALSRAMILIEELGELILLAVIPSPSEKKFLDKEMYKLLRKKAENLIKNVISDICSNDFIINGIVEDGDPAAVIIDVANKLNVELIVLGCKGTSEIGQYLIGSVANKVVQYAHKPVMLVR
jgi:nucleotide-binding universal stress UspA family protein